jgi:hypothetical protein
VLTIGCRSVTVPDLRWDSTTVVLDRLGTQWLAVGPA